MGENSRLPPLDFARGAMSESRRATAFAHQFPAFERRELRVGPSGEGWELTEMYPVVLKLHGRRVVLVGGGKVAAGKLEGLLAAGAQVTVVAPEIRPELARSGVTLVRRAFEPADLDEAWYVVAA